MDIYKKGFSKTKILLKYYPYQQYLWRDCDGDVEPQRMVMTRLMFGISYSPYGAIGSTHQHAANEEMKVLYLDICEGLKISFYVDDWQNGGENENDVITQYGATVKFFQAGGQWMTKFASNSTEVMKTISLEDRHLHVVVDLDTRDDNIYPYPKHFACNGKRRKIAILAYLRS